MREVGVGMPTVPNEAHFASAFPRDPQRQATGQPLARAGSHGAQPDTFGQMNSGSAKADTALRRTHAAGGPAARSPLQLVSAGKDGRREGAHDAQLAHGACYPVWATGPEPLAERLTYRTSDLLLPGLHTRRRDHRRRLDRLDSEGPALEPDRRWRRRPQLPLLSRGVWGGVSQCCHTTVHLCEDYGLG